MRTKRILTILLVVALTIVCGAMSVAAQDDANSFQMAVEVKSSTAMSEELCILKPGNGVEVSVMITENTGLSRVFGFDIKYDAEALELVLTEEGDVDFTTYKLLGERTAENVYVKAPGVVAYRTGGVDSTIKPTGKLVTLKFIVKEAFEGTINITVDGYQNNIVFADGSHAYDEEGNANEGTNVVIKDSNTPDYDGATIYVHEYGEPIVQEATCTTEGTITYPCTTCDEKVVVKTSDVLPHTPGAEATCTDPQVCTECGFEIAPAKGHSPEDAPEKEATCTEDGLTGKTVCTVCNETLEEQVIPAKGHTPGDEATCTTAQVCTVCNAELAPAKGHTPGDEATCTTAQVCTVCDAELAPAKGHTPGDEATCTAAQVCTACDTELASAKGHTYGDWEVVKEATTKEEGVQAKTCTACGHQITESIPKIESNDAWVWIVVIVTVVVLAGGGFCLYWFVFKKKK